MRHLRRQTGMLLAGIQLFTLLCSLPLEAKESNFDETFISMTRAPLPLTKIPSNTSVITSKQIKDRGAITLSDVLDSIPGIDLTKNGSLGSFTAMRMRGSPASAQVQLVIDDQPIGGVSNQFIDLSQVSADMIERVEVVRGASSVLYGANTIGGVIHVITKKSKDPLPTAYLNGEVRSYRTKIGQIHAGGEKNNFDFLIGMNQYTTDGFQQNSGAENTSFHSNLGYAFQGGSYLGAQFRKTDQESGNPKGTNVPFSQWDGEKEKASADRNETIEQDQTDLRLKYIQPVGPLGIIQSMVYGFDQDYFTRPSKNAFPSFQQKNNTYGGETRLIGNHGFTLGSSYVRDERENRGESPLHATNWGLYAQQELKAGKWQFIPALRFDQHSAYGNEYNPRLTALYDLTSWWLVSANMARAYRAPSFLELYFRSAFFNGNPHLRPEKAWTYDFGNQFLITENTLLKLTNYYTRISDRISVNSNFDSYINAPKAELAGTEVEIKGTYGRFSPGANYTFQRAKGNTLTSAKFVELRQTPRHKMNADLKIEFFRGLHLFNSVRYVSKQFRGNNRSGGKLPPFATWNTRLSQDCRFGQLYFGVNNILNRRYAEAFDSDPISFATTLTPQPDRTYYGGIQIKLQ
ncbi:MAG: TonB-dependent receptor plug domain-containing protein [Elusimicrobiota bacterium]